MALIFDVNTTETTIYRASFVPNDSGSDGLMYVKKCVE